MNATYDRRESPRYAIDSRCNISHLVDGKLITKSGVVTDLSLTGARVRFSDSFAPGTTLVLQFVGMSMRPLYVKVVRCYFDPKASDTNKGVVIALRIVEGEIPFDVFARLTMNRQVEPRTPPKKHTIPPSFKFLQLPLDSDEADIKRAYRQLAQTYHPDCGGSAEQFQALQNAYREAIEHVRNRDS